MTITKRTARYEIVKPNGDEEKIYDIVEYCEANNINSVGMTMVLNGFADSYQGFSIRKL